MSHNDEAGTIVAIPVESWVIRTPKNPPENQTFCDAGLYALAFSLQRSFTSVGAGADWGEPLRFVFDHLSDISAAITFTLPSDSPAPADKE